MFRDGQYIEVIKASDDCLATAVVTVQEKTVEIRKQKVVTNKWLQIEDWAALYKILERALLRNRRDTDGSQPHRDRCEWKKSTRQLEVTYTFESLESANDITFLPTIKVHVSPARKKSVKREANDETPKGTKTKQDSNDGESVSKRLKVDESPDRAKIDARGDRLLRTPEELASPKKPETPRTSAEPEDPKRKKSRKCLLPDDLENAPLEEYIPDAPSKSCPDFKYVPSQKSTLENMRLSNEYTPTLTRVDSKHVEGDASYVPNSIEKLEVTYETYEPRATMMIPEGILEEYVPNSKGPKPSVEEYEPGFRSSSKSMKFDDSYVPSSVRQSAPNDSKRTSPDKAERLKAQKSETRRKGTPTKKRMEDLFS